MMVRMSAVPSSRVLCSSVVDLRLARVLRALKAEPARPWRVSELAKLAGASRASLVRLFHATTGLAPKRWLSVLRLELAAELLAHGAPTLSEVALAVGYRSVFSFSRAFKRQYGVAPADFRRGGGSMLRCAA
jgi:AraC-like DNA-binding protein